MARNLVVAGFLLLITSALTNAQENNPTEIQAQARQVQLDLVWTGHYPGPVDGVFGPSTLKALQRFQLEHNEAPTGALSHQLLDTLSAYAQQERRKVGFRQIADLATGTQIGIPLSLTPNHHKTVRGTQYSSSDGSIEIETFAISTTIRDLHSLYQRLKTKVLDRTVWYSPLHDDWFVLAGKDSKPDKGDKYFYVRVHSNGVQLRGFSVSYNPDKYANISAILGAMSFTFDPFPLNIAVNNPPVTVAHSEAAEHSSDNSNVQSSNSNSPKSVQIADRASANSGLPPSVIALENRGGTYEVPVVINNAITLPFVIDSGASDVVIPADVVLTLIRTGTINSSDFIGERKYQLADGSTVPSTAFRLRSLRVGDKVLENVIGGVAPVKGDLLLGQSFLSRFHSWSINNTTHELELH